MQNTALHGGAHRQRLNCQAPCRSNANCAHGCVQFIGQLLYASQHRRNGVQRDLADGCVVIRRAKLKYGDQVRRKCRHVNPDGFDCAQLFQGNIGFGTHRNNDADDTLAAKWHDDEVPRLHIQLVGNQEVKRVGQRYVEADFRDLSHGGRTRRDRQCRRFV